MYPHLITALIIGLAGGLILGLTFVYSILFTPMQRRLKREVVNIQLDNEKLRKDFSHYKRRARRKLKHYRELELRSGRTEIYAADEKPAPNPEDQVEEAIDRAISAVKSLPPETSEEKKRRDRYARAARGEVLSERTGTPDETSNSITPDDDDDVKDSIAAQWNELELPAASRQVVLPSNSVLDDLTDLALEAKKVKQPRSVRKSRGKTSFLDSLRRKQESLANQVTETDEYGSTGLTQTIEMPLREDDVDNWQDFESEVERELSDTSHALDIFRDSTDFADRATAGDLRIDEADVRGKPGGANRRRSEARPQKSKRAKSLLKPRVAVVDSALDQDMESTVPPPRITTREESLSRANARGSGKARKSKKEYPDEGFLKALRRRRRAPDDDESDDFDIERQTGS